jgi:hypothetical protein
MGPTAPTKNEPGPAGCFAGLGIGVATTALVIATAENPIDFSDAWPSLIFLVLAAAAPFALLATLGITAKVPWLTAIGLHLFAWGGLSLFAFNARGEGALIGLGLFVLAYPILIAGGGLAAARLTGSIPND